MPAISYDNYKISDAAKAKQSSRDITIAMFDELNLWFSKIVPIIEAEWRRGVENKDNRTFTEFKLAGLAGEVNSIKDFLLLYVNQQIKATKPLAIADFMLPLNATIKGTKLPLEMIAAAFQALNPWFQAITNSIKPYFAACASAPDDTMQTIFRLSGLANQVNSMKNYIVNYVNKVIARKEGTSSGFSGGAGDDEVADIPDKAADEVLGLMDVGVGENQFVVIDEGDIGVTGFADI